ncbi:hypothetical protein [Stappia sp.]|uniref:hypothetical protein n=1 Tax=Stappia sp. TaxID=1870903 RepID=UPI0032D99271
MLAAAESRSDRALETVKLVLALETKQQQYPDTLKAYFKEVVQQTMALLKSPSESASTALPEAVSLAVRLSSNEDLRMAIEQMLQQDDIDADKAETALNSLEAGFDPNIESAHFSKEIYAAI